ncbi:hypothetical protein N7486_003157 [Penicillium sp. IBT 16267x]|nr:hypothetical protein N7486_003157 [Penicillium sp. IBT 16267x]
MVRGYIYSVNEIADLEIQSYLWESTGGSLRGKYHIFARTRTAPYLFYYRWLEVIGGFWAADAMELVSLDENGGRDPLGMPALLNSRLYMFMPPTIMKTILMYLLWKALELCGPTKEWEDIQQVIGAPTKDELRMSPQKVADVCSNASALEHTSAGLMALPRIMSQPEPMGVGASMQLDASIAGKAIMLNAGVWRAGVPASTDAASRVSRKAQMIRQLQDRRF